MDKYEFQKWMDSRLHNGRTIAEEMKYVDVSWRDEKDNWHQKELPSFQEAVEFAKTLNLEKIRFLDFWYHCIYFGFWRSY